MVNTVLLDIHCKGNKKKFPRCALRAFAEDFFRDFEIPRFRDSEGGAFRRRRCRFLGAKAAPSTPGGAAFLRLPQVVDDQCHLLWEVSLGALRSATGEESFRQLGVSLDP